jgi:hypothetical protein
MTDIDFDELDKAVNSLMGKAVSKDPDDAVKAKTLSISSTLKPGEKPLYDKLGEVARGIGNETLVTEGERTVVEELKSPLPTTELAIAELDTIQSSHDADKPAPAASQPKASAVKRPNSGRVMDVVRSSSNARPPVSNPTLVVPDRGVSQEDTAPSVPEVVTAEPDELQLEKTEAVDSQPIEPTRLTPFLPDTKVEKRPLGGDPTASAGAVVSPFDDEKNDDASDEDSEENSRKKPDAQHLPDPTTVEAEPSAEERKVQAIESAETEIVAPTAESVRAVESGDTEKLNTGSITQQYQAKPAESVETAESAGAIYDVKEYHQALGHPAKQKSGWGVVLLIIVIIIACAAIGAAAYFILGVGL